MGYELDDRFEAFEFAGGRFPAEVDVVDASERGTFAHDLDELAEGAFIGLSDDFNATIGYALGLPLDFVVHSPSGRPFTVAHKGKPVRALFSS